MSFPQAAPSSTVPERAANFVGSLGVNVHLGQAGYAPAKVIAEMAYLGLDNVRASAINSNTPAAVTAALGQLAAAGLKFDLFTGASLGATIAGLDAFEIAYPGAVSSIEGPNEVNNFPITFDGLTGAAAAVAYQDSLYAMAKSDPLLASVPIIDFTDSPAVAADANAANAHPYPKNGSQPMPVLAAALGRVEAMMPSAPVYFTEAGFFTLPTPGSGGVDDETQAKLTLNLIMDAAKLGVSATYLFDLSDDGPDPAQSVSSDHFGLFSFDNIAKPSAVAIHNLTAILRDPGPNADGFTPTALNYSVTGLPSTGESLIIEKSSGVYDIVIWAEPPIWNSAAGGPVVAPTEDVTVSFGGAFGTVKVFDPLLSDRALLKASDAGSVTVGLTDHPLIIQLNGFVGAMSSLGAAAAASNSQTSALMLRFTELPIGVAGPRWAAIA